MTFRLFDLIDGRVNRLIVQYQSVCADAGKAQALQRQQNPFANNLVSFLIESWTLAPEDEYSNVLCRAAFARA